MCDWRIQKKDVKTLLALLEDAQVRQNYMDVAKCYLQLGETYKKEGKRIKALYYLNRFDNLVGGYDRLYNTFEKEDDKVMEWITELEMDLESDLYEQEIQEQVVEKAEELNLLQKMQWLLLTMSRFCTLFQHVSDLSGFEEFGRLEEMVTYLYKGFYEELDEEEEWELDEFGDMLNEMFDSLVMSDHTKKVDIPGKESFVPADLESGEGTHFFSMAYEALQGFIFDQIVESEVEMEFAACGILADYYYRTCEIDDNKDIKEKQNVQEEVERIFSDYAFVQENPDKEKLWERIEMYKKIILV